VLRHRPSGQRKAYAAALVAQLKLQFQASHSAMAFGGVDASKLSARVGLIRAPGNAEQNRWSRGVALCALAAVAALSIMLQPALAWNSGAESMALRCTELMEADSGKLLVRQGQCATRVTPASTFKIPTSLMGFDSGILKDEHTPKLPFHEGYADWVPAWRTDTDPASWMKNSVVWYSQLITAQLGVTRLQGYLRGFGYGNHDVSGDPGANNGLTLSWLNSSLQISPDEQVDFLRRMVKRELPVKAEAYDMTARIMKQETTANGWDIYGKTGTGAPVKADGKDDDAHAYGWFVGWASKGQRTIVFAYLNQDREEVDGAAGPRARDTFLREFRARLATL
jgi:beta-lactamase class D